MTSPFRIHRLHRDADVDCPRRCPRQHLLKGPILLNRFVLGLFIIIRRRIIGNVIINAPSEYEPIGHQITHIRLDISFFQRIYFHFCYFWHAQFHKKHKCFTSFTNSIFNNCLSFKFESKVERNCCAEAEKEIWSPRCDFTAQVAFLDVQKSSGHHKC